MKLRIRSKALAKALKGFQSSNSFELELSKGSKRSLSQLEKKLQRMFGFNAFRCYKSRNDKVLIINNLKINNKKDEFNFFK